MLKLYLCHLGRAFSLCPHCMRLCEWQHLSGGLFSCGTLISSPESPVCHPLFGKHSGTLPTGILYSRGPPCCCNYLFKYYVWSTITCFLECALFNLKFLPKLRDFVQSLVKISQTFQNWIKLRTVADFWQDFQWNWCSPHPAWQFHLKDSILL